MTEQEIQVLEGTLRLRLDDGRELSALVFGAEHAARVLERWAAGDCGEDYQAASGGHYPCAGRAGHPGRCGHRAKDTERTEHGDAPAPEPGERPSSLGATPILPGSASPKRGSSVPLAASEGSDLLSSDGEQESEVKP